ncbi:MAG: alpha/beta fold hydrolase [Acidobacteriota bacterium]
MDHIEGFYWTIRARLTAPRELPSAATFATEVHDPLTGVVPLSGWLHRSDEATADTLLIILHGLGGSPDSRYVGAALAAAEAAHIDALRFGLRGSDGAAGDFYHAGLTADLEAVIAAPAIAPYRRIVVLGYSLGGHVALRYATESPDPRVIAVAAVSSPLDLGRGQKLIDRPGAWLYRRYLLDNLTTLWQDVHAQWQATHVALPDVERIKRVRTLREFDSLTVVPRFGFSDADDYYQSASVGPRLGSLAIPALLVAARQDALVPPGAIDPWVEPAPRNLDVRWARRGGHVGFMPNLDLGQPGRRGLESQTLAWLLRH